VHGRLDRCRDRVGAASDGAISFFSFRSYPGVTDTAEGKAPDRKQLLVRLLRRRRIRWTIDLSANAERDHEVQSGNECESNQRFLHVILLEPKSRVLLPSNARNTHAKAQRPPDNLANAALTIATRLKADKRSGDELRPAHDRDRLELGQTGLSGFPQVGTLVSCRCSTDTVTLTESQH